MAINITKLSMVALVAGTMLVPTVSSAHMEKNKNVFDERNNAVVDARGNCVITKWTAAGNKCSKAAPKLSLAQRTIYFGFDSAELTPKAKKKLQYIAKIAKSSDAIVSASIVGHADRIGNAEYNQKLSIKRAKAAQRYLAKLGLKSNVVKLAAKGERAPVSKGCGKGGVDSKTISCLQPDRRVEIRLKYKR